jgi:hypothetical protein
MSTTAPMVERTVSYERETSPVATLRRQQTLERKIEREIKMHAEPYDLPGQVQKVRPDTSC